MAAAVLVLVLMLVLALVVVVVVVVVAHRTSITNRDQVAWVLGVGVTFAEPAVGKLSNHATSVC